MGKHGRPGVAWVTGAVIRPYDPPVGTPEPPVGDLGWLGAWAVELAPPPPGPAQILASSALETGKGEDSALSEVSSAEEQAQPAPRPFSPLRIGRTSPILPRQTVARLRLQPRHRY